MCGVSSSDRELIRTKGYNYWMWWLLFTEKMPIWIRYYLDFILNSWLNMALIFPAFATWDAGSTVWSACYTRTIVIVFIVQFEKSAYFSLSWISYLFVFVFILVFVVVVVFVFLFLLRNTTTFSFSFVDIWGPLKHRMFLGHSFFLSAVFSLTRQAICYLLITYNTKIFVVFLVVYLVDLRVNNRLYVVGHKCQVAELFFFCFNFMISESTYISCRNFVFLSNALKWENKGENDSFVVCMLTIELMVSQPACGVKTTSFLLTGMSCIRLAIYITRT